MNRIPELELIYNNILLVEKDHRQKIVKFGIPQDVADYLHQLDDKYSIWFADKIKNMEGFQSSKNKVNWIQTHLLTDIQGILDWVKNNQDTLLKNYTWDQAVQAQREYHQNIETRTLNQAEKNKIIKQYDDGFYWVDLLTNRCSEEASAMGHCASTRADTLFSLRRYTPETNSIESFVTIGASPDDGVWTQAKGKRNSFPKEIYHKYIANILVDNGMLKYSSEYDSSNDFTATQLKEYIENHPNEFQNSDELLAKIEESSVSYKDFKKIYDELEMNSLKYYNVYLDNDSSEDYLRHSVNFSMTIPLDKFKDYAENVKQFIIKDNPYSGEDSKKSRTIIEYLMGKYFSFNWCRVYVDENENIEISTDVEDNDDMSSLSDSGLNNFTNFCQHYQYEDKHVDEDKLFNNLVEYFRDSNVIPEDEEDTSIKPIKPKKPEDPRQMKFDFMNTNENVFYKLYSDILNETIE